VAGDQHQDGAFGVGAEGFRRGVLEPHSAESASHGRRSGHSRNNIAAHPPTARDAVADPGEPRIGSDAVRTAASEYFFPSGAKRLVVCVLSVREGHDTECEEVIDSFHSVILCDFKPGSITTARGEPALQRVVG
jgi:hypothetical protein